MKNQLTDSCGNWLLLNDYINTFCEINSVSLGHEVVEERLVQILG